MGIPRISGSITERILRASRIESLFAPERCLEGPPSTARDAARIKGNGYAKLVLHCHSSAYILRQLGVAVFELTALALAHRPMVELSRKPEVSHLAQRVRAQTSPLS
jgi:hypothetical protein